jgi:hypothetical protein
VEADQARSIGTLIVKRGQLLGLYTFAYSAVRMAVGERLAGKCRQAHREREMATVGLKA